MPRCPNCNYPSERWISPDPCPECGVIAREHVRSFWTPRQHLAAFALILIAVVAQLLFAIGAHAPYLFDGIAHTLSVHPETLAILVFAAALLAPAVLIYLTLVGYTRGLSRKAPVLIATTMIIPTCFVTIMAQWIIALLL